MGRYSVRLQKLDPTYKLPEVKRQTADACFIATAALGDYDHPDVLILREFRDEVLGKSLLGRAFINLYYTASPLFASWIAKDYQRRRMSRKFLVKPVAVLADKFMN